MAMNYQLEMDSNQMRTNIFGASEVTDQATMLSNQYV